MPKPLARAGAFSEKWEPNKAPPPIALETKLHIFPSGSSRFATSRCDVGKGCRVVYTLDTASVGRARTKRVFPSVLPSRHICDAHQLRNSWRCSQLNHAAQR